MNDGPYPQSLLDRLDIWCDEVVFCVALEVMYI